MSSRWDSARLLIRVAGPYRAGYNAAQLPRARRRSCDAAGLLSFTTTFYLATSYEGTIRCGRCGCSIPMNCCGPSGGFDLAASALAAPRAATEEELQWLHGAEYIAAVRSFSLGLSGYDPQRYNFSAEGDNPTYRGMYDAAALSTGASLAAAELLADGRVDAAFSISGGLHHAAANHASGFCVFNDPALAIHYLLEQGLRVAYVDIDAHHGDGVQEAFFDDDRVLTISVHESGQYLFPGTGFVQELGTGRGAGYSVNLPLYPYTGDEVYLEAFHAVVPPLLRAFAPDVLVTQLGIDSYHTDPLTHLQITNAGIRGGGVDVLGNGGSLAGAGRWRV